MGISLILGIIGSTVSISTVLVAAFLRFWRRTSPASFDVRFAPPGSSDEDATNDIACDKELVLHRDPHDGPFQWHALVGIGFKGAEQPHTIEIRIDERVTTGQRLWLLPQRRFQPIFAESKLRCLDAQTGHWWASNGWMSQTTHVRPPSHEIRRDRAWVRLLLKGEWNDFPKPLDGRIVVTEYVGRQKVEEVRARVRGKLEED